MLGSIAARNKIGRPPLAHAAATLNLLTRGRSTPSPDSSTAAIRALWGSKGELVNRDSEFFPLRNAIFDLPSHKGRWQQIGIVRTGRACFAWSVDTRMATFPRSGTDLTSAHGDLKRCGRPHPTPDMILPFFRIMRGLKKL